ncbi:hypothetical protein [Methanothrix sp.]|uniref:hypothetical protein n=1 Tax=Methanothrix sp. TaxID=90426 RepID=UPI003298FFE7
MNIYQKSVIPPPQEKMRNFAEASQRKAAAIKRDGFHGSRWEALRFCLVAFGAIWQTNAALILRARGSG